MTPAGVTRSCIRMDALMNKDLMLTSAKPAPLLVLTDVISTQSRARPEAEKLSGDSFATFKDIFSLLFVQMRTTVVESNGPRDHVTHTHRLCT